MAEFDWREIDDALRAMIGQAAGDGSARISDVRITAFTFAGALNWSARWYHPDGPTPPAAMAKAMVDTLCAGISPDAASCMI